MSIGVVIVAAGRGRRLGGPTPKQYLPLGSGAVIGKTAQAFLGIDRVSSLVVVINPADVSLYDEAMIDIEDKRVLPPVAGGKTRGASVKSGLESLTNHFPQKVLIHDAARPFVARPSIEAVIDALDTQVAACVALRVVDALWHRSDAGGLTPVARDDMWRAQTPQGFHFDAILAAHLQADGDAADDVTVAVAAGMPVTFVDGTEQNYKITTAADYERALRDELKLGAND